MTFNQLQNSEEMCLEKSWCKQNLGGGGGELNHKMCSDSYMDHDDHKLWRKA